MRQKPKTKKWVTIEDECMMGETRAKKETDTYKGKNPPSPEKRMKEMNIRGYEKPRSASWAQDNVKADPGGAIIHPWIGRGITTQGFR